MTASRLAEEPKLQSSGWRTPTARAKIGLELLGEAARGQPEIQGRVGKVHHIRSSASKVPPDIGTGVWPGTKAHGANARS